MYAGASDHGVDIDIDIDQSPVVLASCSRGGHRWTLTWSVLLCVSVSTA